MSWLRSYSSLKKEELLSTRLRHAIRLNKDVRAELPDLEQDLRGKSTALTAEALKSKDLEDGQNLLLYAAALGTDVSFTSLVKVIKERLGRHALVEQLRESDIDGAPLLFKAASSSSVECLIGVCKVIERVAGQGELREQLQARDLNGRTIVLHAAKSKSALVFNEVTRLLLEDYPPNSWLVVNEPEYREDGNKQQHRPVTIAGKNVVVDYKGMNLLHHWSHSGCARILIEVTTKAREEQGNAFVHSFLRAADYAGRTPLMHVLRHGGSGDYGSEAPLKVNLLLDLMTQGHEGVHNTESDLVLYLTRPSSHWYDCTALMHAAHGGPKQLEVVREKICNLAPHRCHADGGLDLNFALGINDEDRQEIIGGRSSEFKQKMTRRHGMLLAEAASGGHVSVIEGVVSAIKTGALRRNDTCAENCNDQQGNNRVKEAIESATDCRGTIVTLAVSSHKSPAVESIVGLVKTYISNPLEVWNLLSGGDTHVSNLTFAASIPVSPSTGDNGRDMFRVLYAALKEAADHAYGENAVHYLRQLFIPEAAQDARSLRTPLAGSLFCSNQVLFEEVYDTYKTLSNTKAWTRQQILTQIPTRANFGAEDVELYSMASKGGVADISPTMMFTVIKAMREATPAKEDAAKLREQRSMSQRMQRLVQVAAERGAFDLFRVLANEQDPLHNETIPSLLERIGDYEENIIDAVTLAVSSGRNPFAVSAVASRYISIAETELPMHRIGLRLLQCKIDTLIQEMLDVLPHTVRGVGMAFGAHEPALLKLAKDPETHREHDRLGAMLGLVVVRWILEPSTVDKRVFTGSRDGSNDQDESTASRFPLLPSHIMDCPESIDPLQRALDRGSKALDFINSPLVLDYVLLKFSRHIPSWNSRRPLQCNMDDKYYTHTPSDPTKDPTTKKDDPTLADLLLRFLQGYDEGIHGEQRLQGFRIPHVTFLPGLQFSLAGVIGKPSAFFDVPAIIFTYELLSYIVILGLFYSCVVIGDYNSVPIRERVFYMFVLGLFWREVLEFRGVLPSHRDDQEFHSNPDLQSRAKAPPHRLVAAITRYLFYDAWNILDTSTILCVAAAFVFRIIALHEDSTKQTTDGADANATGLVTYSFFMAQTLLAASAPLLFARVLSLSQIDDTLGPMTQIIWTMMSHLARFSVFVGVLIMSFAVAFHALFYECKDDYLQKAYGTVARSCLTMFRAMLGDFYFDDLTAAKEYCRLPWAMDAAVGLLVLYLVLVAILLLNLLIAVLSTVHAEVYANAEKEFHLARAKLIQQSCRAALKERQPPPINLLAPVAGFLVDVLSEAWDLIVLSRHLHAGNKPISETHTWNTVLGAIHRAIFASVMGSTALATYAILWAVSLPWTAWRLLRWRFPRNKNQPYWSKGYFRPMVAAAFTGLGWLLAVFVAAILSTACILGSVALWVCGLWGIWQWYNIEMVSRSKGKNTRERDCLFAEDIVSKQNRDCDAGVRHFRADRLLKTITGLDVEDLSLRIMRREEAALKRSNGGTAGGETPMFYRQHSGYSTTSSCDGSIMSTSKAPQAQQIVARNSSTSTSAQKPKSDKDVAHNARKGYTKSIS